MSTSSLIRPGRLGGTIRFERFQLFFPEAPDSPRDSVRLTATSLGAVDIDVNGTPLMSVQLAAAPWQVFGASGEFALTLNIQEILERFIIAGLTGGPAPAPEEPSFPPGTATCPPPPSDAHRVLSREEATPSPTASAVPSFPRVMETRSPSPSEAHRVLSRDEGDTLDGIGVILLVFVLFVFVAFLAFSVCREARRRVILPAYSEAGWVTPREEPAVAVDGKWVVFAVFGLLVLTALYAFHRLSGHLDESAWTIAATGIVFLVFVLSAFVARFAVQGPASEIEFTGPGRGRYHGEECAVVLVPGLDPRIMDDSSQFDCSGIVRPLKYEKETNAIAYPQLTAFNLHDCDLRAFLIRMLGILKCLWERGYMIDTLVERDLFKAELTPDVLGRFIEKLHRSSEWTEQSENLKQLANLVPLPAQPDLYLEDLLRVMKGPAVDRPQPEKMLLHPFFWSEVEWWTKIDHWDGCLNQWAPAELVQFEHGGRAAVGGPWPNLIDSKLLDEMSKHRRYSPAVRDLVALIRNLLLHRDDYRERFRPYFAGLRKTFWRLFVYMYREVH
jgi:hypothetical protein